MEPSKDTPSSSAGDDSGRNAERDGSSAPGAEATHSQPLRSTSSSSEKPPAGSRIRPDRPVAAENGSSPDPSVAGGARHPSQPRGSRATPHAGAPAAQDRIAGPPDVVRGGGRNEHRPDDADSSAEPGPDTGVTGSGAFPLPYADAPPEIYSRRLVREVSRSGVITSETRTRSDSLDPIVIENYPHASRTDLFVRLYEDGLGNPLEVPFVVVRGREAGPVLGISAAVHGNELNGVKVIHRLLNDLDPTSFRGALLLAPVVSVPAYNHGRREFPDGNDLNHVFPGKANGNPAEQYARAFTLAFLPALNYLVDIHTASEGRTNTLYVRADLLSEETQALALTTNPQIILHAKGGDGTLRNAARQRNIPAITMEVGNPSVFQGEMVSAGEHGVFNVMRKLGMLPGDPEMVRIPVICSSSSWLRTTGGGLLETRFELLDHIKRGQLLAETYDPFGRVLQSYHAPYDGIVIGMAANPLAIPGTRFCHLGVIGSLSQFVRRKRKKDPSVPPQQ